MSAYEPPIARSKASAPKRKDLAKQPLQTALEVSEPGDALEQEADRVADHVMRMAEPAPHVSASSGARVDRACAKCEAAEEEPKGKGMVQRKPLSGFVFRSQAAAPSFPGPSRGFQQSLGVRRSAGGEPLPASLRGIMEGRFRADFAGVRVHRDAAASELTKQVQAKAFTVGSDVFFRQGHFEPASDQGKRLIAHELTHVVQQRRGAAPAVQRAIKPEDVASEMVGRQFELTQPFVTGTVFGPRFLSPGERVTVTSWDNAKETASATHLKLESFSALAPPIPIPAFFEVPKKILKPVNEKVAGVAPFSAGVSSQASAVEKAENTLAGHIAKKGSFKTKKGLELFENERARLEGVLSKKREVLNRKLIQDTMFNRFDAVIKREVDAANATHKVGRTDALDPNLLKSMLFQESQLGTAGFHLEQPPSHPVKSRFNLGQVIDSSGSALLLMLEREQPALVAKHGLGSLRTDLAAAQSELAALQKKTTRTAAEDARLAELKEASKQSWEGFIWGYGAGPTGFSAAVEEFFASGSPAKNLDFEFWIHMAVMWLYEKKKPGRSWAATIQAYNGSGAAAVHYREAVLKRAADAVNAEKAGKPFVPSGI